VTVPSVCSTPAPQASVSLGRLSIGGSARAAAPVRNPFQLVDLQARSVHYLRVSVTDRCNYRCSYCMPAEGVDVVPREDLLTFAEIEQLVHSFVALGIRKVRLTGGEPLVRRGIVDLVARIARIEGVQDLAMTTNGHLLSDLAKPLREAGLHRLNVSMDTLDEQAFAQVTRQGSLTAVLAGLEAARNAGFTHTKINAVVLRGHNLGELSRLCDFAAAHGYILRLIEYMPIGVDQHWGADTFVASAEVREELSRDWDLQPDPGHGHPGGGPAVYWTGRRRTGGPDVRLGFISAVSEKFCKLCNRVRLSPTGTLRECLSTGGVLSLRDMIRGGRSEAEVQDAIRLALLGKVEGHRFDGAVQTWEPMSAIGG
jgi:cyclic pyranopterin phosphate synthase